jgi:hypothetical protein
VADLHSERGNGLYYDWVEAEDRIAGPIYAVANGGTWDYALTAEDGPSLRLAPLRRYSAGTPRRLSDFESVSQDTIPQCGRACRQGNAAAQDRHPPRIGPFSGHDPRHKERLKAISRSSGDL